MQVATSTMDVNSGNMLVKRVCVPVGLEELMENLTKEVIMKKPTDLYIFASDYFAELLSMRDRNTNKAAHEQQNSSKNYVSNDRNLYKNDSLKVTKVTQQPRQTKTTKTIKKETHVQTRMEHKMERKTTTIVEGSETKTSMNRRVMTQQNKRTSTTSRESSISRKSSEFSSSGKEMSSRDHSKSRMRRNTSNISSEDEDKKKSFNRYRSNDTNNSSRQRSTSRSDESSVKERKKYISRMDTSVSSTSENSYSSSNDFKTRRRNVAANKKSNTKASNLDEIIVNKMTKTNDNTTNISKTVDIENIASKVTSVVNDASGIINQVSDNLSDKKSLDVDRNETKLSNDNDNTNAMNNNNDSNDNLDGNITIQKSAENDNAMAISDAVEDTEKLKESTLNSEEDVDNLADNLKNLNVEPTKENDATNDVTKITENVDRNAEESTHHDNNILLHDNIGNDAEQSTSENQHENIDNTTLTDGNNDKENLEKCTIEIQNKHKDNVTSIDGKNETQTTTEIQLENNSTMILDNIDDDNTKKVEESTTKSDDEIKDNTVINNLDKNKEKLEESDSKVLENDDNKDNNNLNRNVVVNEDVNKDITMTNADVEVNKDTADTIDHESSNIHINNDNALEKTDTDLDLKDDNDNKSEADSKQEISKNFVVNSDTTNIEHEKVDSDINDDNDRELDDTSDKDNVDTIKTDELAATTENVIEETKNKIEETKSKILNIENSIEGIKQSNTNQAKSDNLNNDVDVIDGLTRTKTVLSNLNELETLNNISFEKFDDEDNNTEKSTNIEENAENAIVQVNEDKQKDNDNIKNLTFDSNNTENQQNETQEKNGNVSEDNDNDKNKEDKEEESTSDSKTTEYRVLSTIPSGDSSESFKSNNVASNKPIEDDSNKTNVDNSNKTNNDASNKTTNEDSSKTNDDSSKTIDESSKTINDSSKTNDATSKANEDSSKTNDDSSKTIDASSKTTDTSTKTNDSTVRRARSVDVKNSTNIPRVSVKPNLRKSQSVSHDLSTPQTKASNRARSVSSNARKSTLKHNQSESSLNIPKQKQNDTKTSKRANSSGIRAPLKKQFSKSADNDIKEDIGRTVIKGVACVEDVWDVTKLKNSPKNSEMQVASTPDSTIQTHPEDAQSEEVQDGATTDQKYTENDKNINSVENDNEEDEFEKLQRDIKKVINNVNVTSNIKDGSSKIRKQYESLSGSTTDDDKDNKKVDNVQILKVTPIVQEETTEIDITDDTSNEQDVAKLDDDAKTKLQHKIDDVTADSTKNSTDTIDDTKKSVENLVDAAKSDVKDIENNLNKNNADLNESVHEIIKKVDEDSDKVKDKVKSEIDNIKSDLNSGMDKTDDVVDSTLDNLTNTNDGLENTLGDLQSNLNKDANKLNELVDDTIDKVDENVGQVTNDIENAVHNVKSDINTSMSKIGEFASSGVKNIAEKVNDITQNASDGVANTVDELHTNLNDDMNKIDKVIDENVNDKVDGIEKKVDELQSNVTEDAHKINKFVDDTVDTITENVDDNMTKAKNTIDDIKTSMNGKEESIVDTVNNTAKIVDEKVDSMIDIIENNVTETINELKSNLNEDKEKIVDDTVDTVKSAVKNVQSDANNIIDEINSKLIKGKDDINDLTELTIDKIDSDVDHAKNNLSLAVEDAKSDLNDNIAKVEETVDSAVQIADADLENTKNINQNTITDEINDINDKISSTSKDISAEKDKVAKSVEDDMQGIKNGLTTTSNNAESKLEETKKEIIEEVALVKDTIKSNLENIDNGVNNTVDKAESSINEAKDNIIEVKNDIQDAKLNITETVTAKVKDLDAKLDEEIDEAKSEASSVVEEMSSKAQNFGKSIKKKTGNILEKGENFAKGIAGKTKRLFSSKKKKNSEEADSTDEDSSGPSNKEKIIITNHFLETEHSKYDAPDKPKEDIIKTNKENSDSRRIRLHDNSVDYDILNADELTNMGDEQKEIFKSNAAILESTKENDEANAFLDEANTSNDANKELKRELTFLGDSTVDKPPEIIETTDSTVQTHGGDDPKNNLNIQLEHRIKTSDFIRLEHEFYDKDTNKQVEPSESARIEPKIAKEFSETEASSISTSNNTDNASKAQQTKNNDEETNTPLKETNENIGNDKKTNKLLRETTETLLNAEHENVDVVEDVIKALKEEDQMMEDAEAVKNLEDIVKTQDFLSLETTFYDSPNGTKNETKSVLENEIDGSNKKEQLSTISNDIERTKVDVSNTELVQDDMDVIHDRTNIPDESNNDLKSNKDQLELSQVDFDDAEVRRNTKDFLKLETENYDSSKQNESVSKKKLIDVDRRPSDTITEELAALKIQSFWKKFREHSRMLAKASNTNEVTQDTKNAAIVIQALFRGYLTRKQMKIKTFPPTIADPDLPQVIEENEEEEEDSQKHEENRKLSKETVKTEPSSSKNDKDEQKDNGKNRNKRSLSQENTAKEQEENKKLDEMIQKLEDRENEEIEKIGKTFDKISLNHIKSVEDPEDVDKNKGNEDLTNENEVVEALKRLDDVRIPLESPVIEEPKQIEENVVIIYPFAVVSAAVKIQKVFRGYKVRKQLQKDGIIQPDKKIKTPTVKPLTITNNVYDVSSSGIPVVANLFDAAVKIQKVYRGFKVRKDLKDLKSIKDKDVDHEKVENDTKNNIAENKNKQKNDDENNAAVTIQRNYRGFKTRKDLNNAKLHNLSDNDVLYIKEHNVKNMLIDGQNTTVRNKVDNLTSQEDMSVDDTKKNAAVMIQKNYRGFKTRKELKDSINGDVKNIELVDDNQKDINTDDKTEEESSCSGENTSSLVHTSEIHDFVMPDISNNENNGEIKDAIPSKHVQNLEKSNSNTYAGILHTSELHDSILSETFYDKKVNDIKNNEDKEDAKTTTESLSHTSELHDGIVISDKMLNANQEIINKNTNGQGGGDIDRVDDDKKTSLIHTSELHDSIGNINMNDNKTNTKIPSDENKISKDTIMEIVSDTDKQKIQETELETDTSNSKDISLTHTSESHDIAIPLTKLTEDIKLHTNDSNNARIIDEKSTQNNIENAENKTFEEDTSTINKKYDNAALSLHGSGELHDMVVLPNLNGKNNITTTCNENNNSNQQISQDTNDVNEVNTQESDNKKLNHITSVDSGLKVLKSQDNFELDDLECSKSFDDAEQRENAAKVLQKQFRRYCSKANLLDSTNNNVISRNSSNDILEERPMSIESTQSADTVVFVEESEKDNFESNKYEECCEVYNTSESLDNASVTTASSEILDAKDNDSHQEVEVIGKTYPELNNDEHRVIGNSGFVTLESQDLSRGNSADSTIDRSIKVEDLLKVSLKPSSEVDDKILPDCLKEYVESVIRPGTVEKVDDINNQHTDKVDDIQYLKQNDDINKEIINTKQAFKKKTVDTSTVDVNTFDDDGDTQQKARINKRSIDDNASKDNSTLNDLKSTVVSENKDVESHSLSGSSEFHDNAIPVELLKEKVTNQVEDSKSTVDIIKNDDDNHTLFGSSEFHDVTIPDKLLTESRIKLTESTVDDDDNKKNVKIDTVPDSTKDIGKDITKVDDSLNKSTVDEAKHQESHSLSSTSELHDSTIPEKYFNKDTVKVDDSALEKSTVDVVQENLTSTSELHDSSIPDNYLTEVEVVHDEKLNDLIVEDSKNNSTSLSSTSKHHDSTIPNNYLNDKADIKSNEANVDSKVDDENDGIRNITGSSELHDLVLPDEKDDGKENKSTVEEEKLVSKTVDTTEKLNNTSELHDLVTIKTNNIDANKEVNESTVDVIKTQNETQTQSNTSKHDVKTSTVNTKDANSTETKENIKSTNINSVNKETSVQDTSNITKETHEEISKETISETSSSSIVKQEEAVTSTTKLEETVSTEENATNKTVYKDEIHEETNNKETSTNKDENNKNTQNNVNKQDKNTIIKDSNVTRKLQEANEKIESIKQKIVETNEKIERVKRGISHDITTQNTNNKSSDDNIEDINTKIMSSTTDISDHDNTIDLSSKNDRIDDAITSDTHTNKNKSVKPSTKVNEEEYDNIKNASETVSSSQIVASTSSEEVMEWNTTQVKAGDGTSPIFVSVATSKLSAPMSSLGEGTYVATVELPSLRTTPDTSLVHTGEYHDTPMGVEHSPMEKQEENSLASGLQGSGEFHDQVLPLAVQLNQSPGQVFVIIVAGSDTSNNRRLIRRKSSGKVLDNNKMPKFSQNDLEEKSATKIQAGVRGFLVRKRQKKDTKKTTQNYSA